MLFPLPLFFQNQFFISGLSGDEIIQNRVLEALYRRILQAHKEQKLFRVIIVIPLLPGFQVHKMILAYLSLRYVFMINYCYFFFSFFNPGVQITGGC